MRKTFRSLGEAYIFYNQYAKERGFIVRKDSLKFSKGPEGTMRLRKYLESWETTGKTLYNGRQDPQAQRGDSLLL